MKIHNLKIHVSGNKQRQYVNPKVKGGLLLVQFNNWTNDEIPSFDGNSLIMDILQSVAHLNKSTH